MATANSSTPTTSTPTATTASASSPVATLTGAGTTVINDGVIAKIVGIAVREVPGVYAIGGGAARALGAIRDAMGNTDLAQGVSVEVGETQVAADVTIVAEYPVSLQKVAGDVRTAAYRAIQNLVGMDVAEVNVTVVDVHIPGEDTTAPAPVEGAAVTGSRVQ